MLKNTHTFLKSLKVWFFAVGVIPLGLSSAVCIKVGQNVGAGDPIKAQTTSRVGILVGWITALFTSTFYISLKDIVPKAYTSNIEILQLTSKVMPQIATYNFINITMLVLNGILRGTGHQKYGGIVTVIAHYVIGVPLMVVLVLYTSLEIAGVWWAFCTAIVFMFVLYAAKILSISWENECKKAQERTAVTFKDHPVCGGRITNNTSSQKVDEPGLFQRTVLKKFIGRYQGLVDKYSESTSQIIHDGLEV